jgi:hypothetical protein
MQTAKISPEEKTSIAAKVGRSNDAHKVKKVINSIFFMTIYMAETDKSQQGIPRLYDPGYLDKKSCPSGLTSPKNSWLWAAMASN